MKYLNKLWLRILVSLFFGGALSETVHILLIAGDEMPPQLSSMLVLVGFTISFLFLSSIVWIHKLYLYYKKDKIINEDILDHEED